MSTTINISSLVGIHQNSNLVTGGGTDDTSIIQTALNGTYAGGLILVQDGVSLVTGLDIPSNVTLQCNTNCGFYLANASNRELLRNKNRSATVITDTNITITGGTYNANKVNQSGVSQADNTPMNGFGFYGISNLLIQNLTVTLSSAWEIGIGNFTNVTVNNCSLTASTGVSNLVTDGVDLRGPGTNATLTNLTIVSGDDAIALNGRNYGSAVTGPFIGGGTISNVKIDTIILNGCFAGVDLIADNTHPIQDVYISNISGTVQNYALYLNRDLFNAPVPTTGSYNNIFLAGSSVTQSGSPFGGLIPAGLYLLDGATAAIQMSGFTPVTQTIKMPTSAGVITSLILNGQQRGPVTGPTTIGAQPVNFVQAAQLTPAGSGTSVAKAYTFNVTATTTLVVFATGFLAGGVTITGISDTIGNAWTQQATFTDGATGHVGAIWTCANKATGANTVTVTFSGSTAGTTIEVAEYGVSSVDVVSSLLFDTAAETTVTCPSLTTAQTNDTVLGIGTTASAGATAGSGFTLRLSGASTALGVLEEAFESAIGAYAPSWTQASNAGNYRATLALKGSASQGSWTISGNTGVGGATVSYTGQATGSVVADSTGNFVISGLANGSYTLTPTLGGYTFSAPAIKTVSTADITGVVFTAIPPSVYSVPDCRIAPFGPNTGVTVQGTIQYTKQTSSNTAIPPVDSRTAGAPVDSRIAAIIRQNSRNNPPF